MSESGSGAQGGDLGTRLRSIRLEIYGPDGAAVLAAELGIALKAWNQYEEIGELAPAQVLLRFIELTGVDPLWLLSGEGPKYRPNFRPLSQQSGNGSTNSTKPRAD